MPSRVYEHGVSHDESLRKLKAALAQPWRLPGCYLSKYERVRGNHDLDTAALEAMAVEDPSNDQLGEGVPIPEGWEETLLNIRLGLPVCLFQ